jgi:hypothetical protein
LSKSKSGVARRWVLRAGVQALKAAARLLVPAELRRVINPALPFSTRVKRVPDTKPRVLLVGDCYYSFWFLSRGLRSLGWTADTLRTSRSPGDQTFLHQTDYAFHYRGTRDRLRHWWFFLRSIRRYDVYHFYGVGNIRLFYRDFDWTLAGILSESWEIRLLRQLGKRIVYTDVGCPDGVLQTSMLALTGEVPCLTCPWRGAPDVCSDSRIHTWGTVRNSLADLVLAQGAWHRDYNDTPKLREVPQACSLDPEFWNPGLMVPTNYRLPLPDGTVTLYHAVGNFALRSDVLSRRNLKSTHVYLDVVERLRADGYAVELAFFQDVPNTKVRFYQLQADIVVDMLTFGWFGANVREALMLGKPVVCYIRPEWLETVRRENPEYAEELPIVSATPETVYDVLRDLIEHPEKRAEIGRRSREFAVKWHSPDAAAARMEKVYTDLLLQPRGRRSNPKWGRRRPAPEAAPIPREGTRP